MHVFITGTGSGIGKTLAEHFLKEGLSVTGISRHQAIEHPRFTFVACDLSMESSRDQIQFPKIEDEQVVLINNAGTLGSIKPFAELSKSDIRTVFRLNVEALMELSLEFIQTYRGKQMTLVHIGSGAASRSIKGWSNYCASKAAVHHFNEVLNDEIEYDPQLKGLRSIVVSPGVVDTPMQEKIRGAAEHDFPDVQKFIEFKQSHQLVSPEEVAQKIHHIVQSSQPLPSLIHLSDYTVQ